MSRYELADGTYSDQYKVGDKFTFTGSPCEANIDWTPEDLEGLFEFVFDDESSCPKFKSLVSGMEDYEDWFLLSKYTPPEIATDSSELTEAYAKIESLESALEDAVREIFSLKHQLIAQGANTCLGIVQEEPEQFKPVQEYTLKDWELALEEGWVFKMRNVGSVQVTTIEHRNDAFPICFDSFRWRTLQGFEWSSENRDDEDSDIIKRIK